ncbi:hypothetical protein GCM10009828_075970 [Actinoplanes couchii]|uniref:Lipoprotein n=1 Tax=Actinoplanes couchii TaxID=403638 RepID=A0ABQ3WZJ3_9ACTN|nr:hypothetical protein Aco03nite_000990 [Actinoplanes couchii]
MTLSAVTLALAIGATGCAKSEDPGVATADPAATGANAPGGGEASPIKYSKCMREQGLSWFPDPQPDGGLVVSEPEGTDHSKVEAAEKACEKFNPGGTKPGKADAEGIARMKQASACMREHGVPNWPDPDANGNVHIDEKSGISFEDETVKKAQQECQKYFPTGQDK